MSLNDTLKQILPTLEQDQQQDPKMLNLDVGVATQVRDELTTIMNDRLGTLEPNVIYPWTKSATGTPTGTGTTGTATPAKK